MDHQPRGLWATPEAPDDISDDYLQDPELWVDHLPQPFRMIDGLLQELVSRTWDEIESRELQRQTERAKVRIPEVVAEGRVRGASGIRAVEAAGRRNLVVIGSLNGVGLTDGNGVELAFSPTASAVTSLAVDQIENVLITAACTEAGITYILASVPTTSGVKLIQLTEISDQEDTRLPVAAYISPTCSHLVLVTSIGDMKCQLECYQLPKSVWMRELAPFLEDVPLGNGDNITRTSSSADMVFSKPSQLFSILPPKPTVPCTSKSPQTALLNVFGEGEVIGTGEHHMLSEDYFKKRRRIFESQRPVFAQQSPPPSIENSSPKCHFLYFKNGTWQEVPCCLLVWWTRHTQILSYSLSAKGSSPVLVQVVPQGSTVCATAVSSSTRYLAVGLESGVITIWDLKTNFCHCVQQVVYPPAIPTTLMFYSPLSPVLAVGTSKGSVLLVTPDTTSLSLTQRLSKQQDTYKTLFETNGYDSSEIVSFAPCSGRLAPSVLVSVHNDGSLVLWSISDLEALCRVVLPSPSPPPSTPMCALTSDTVFLVGSDGCVYYTPLSSVVYLEHHLSQTSGVDPETQSVTGETPGNLMDNVLRTLAEVNNKLLKDNDVFQASRKSRWNDYSQHFVVT